MTTKKIPMRMCMGCREMRPKRELIRVVKTPEGEICVDRTGKQSGRGAYVCDNIECMKKVRRQNALKHAFSAEVPEGVYDRLESEMSGSDK